MLKHLTFQDLNFKLAIINELMYNQGVLPPKFDLVAFIAQHSDRKIDIEEEGYEIIPEVLRYFEELEVPAEFAAKVTEMYQDGGDDIYLEICPFWDGEDDIFNVKSAEDAAMFPNLKSVTLMYDEDDSILAAFEAKGIPAEWL